MNVEANRLKTFENWPENPPVTPQRIAKAGFFATRQGYEVECYACHLRISEWNYGDQAMTKHRTLSPTCPFVLQTTSPNQPPNYSNEETRLATYTNWPVPHIVTPQDLARAGFYSLHQDDNTKCAYCSGIVRAWEPGDIPDVEHQRHFPNCPFVISTINPRLQPNPSGVQNRLPSGSLVQVRTEVDSYNELGLQKHNGPKRVEYSTLESRLRTFSNWSPDLMQTPNVLAEAGFYYEGVGDQVRCFHCDGGLRHWDPDDDPWIEHARWFPSCSFMKLVKGQEFISASALDQGDQRNLPAEKGPAGPRKRRDVSDLELQQHMVSSAALAALRIGIDVQRVRRALKEKLQLTGQGYAHPDALVEAALTMQLEEEDAPENTNARDMATAVLSAAVKSATVPKPPPPAEAAPKPSSTLSLEEENRMLREARQCKICMDAEVGIVFLPCGHLATCVTCAPNLEDCPVCRSAIKATVRTFLS